MAVDPVFHRWQLRLLGRQYQVEAPGRGQAHILDTVGLVGSDDHQGVLEYALFFQAAEKAVDRIVHVGHGGLLGAVEARQIVFGGGVGLMGADGQQGEHPRLFMLAQLTHIGEGAFEIGLVIHAPGELQLRLVAEPVAPAGMGETHVRHDLVLGHELQRSALQEVGTKAPRLQLGWQALLVA